MKSIIGHNRITKLLSIIAPAGLSCLLLPGYSCTAAESPPAELQKAEQVRRLTTQEAERHVPVRLRGVVTFFDEGLYSHFVQDDTAGIYLNTSTNLPPLVPGQLVEVEGVTGAGEFAPVVLPSLVKVLGQAPLPTAQPASIEQLMGGQNDSQFVEVSGIVRSVQFEEETKNYTVDMVSGGERFTAYTKKLPVADPETLVDTTLRVRAVCASLFNQQRQLFAFRLMIPGPSEFTLEQPAPGNSPEIPTQPLNSLLQFTPKSSFGHRVKVVGTVAYYEPGVALFVQAGNEGLYAQTKGRSPLQAGDRVEILGFPAKGEYSPVLQDALYRKIGTDTLPTPEPIGLDEALKGAHDCRLVKLEAKLLDRTQRGREQFLVLQTEGFIFHAYLGQTGSGEGFAPLLNGSEVAVAGVCLIERGSAWRAGQSWRAKSFRLLLRSPSDVTVLQSPPWWTQASQLRMVGILSVLVLIALVGIDILRRRGQKPSGAGR